MKYMYVCERCQTAFEVEVDDKTAAPEAVCPKCEYAHATKLFPVISNTPAAGCKPGGSC